MQIRFIDVVFKQGLRDSFTYALAAEQSETLVGKRVTVMLAKRRLTAFVVNEHEERPSGIPARVQIREIENVLDTLPIFTPELLDLARWISQFYLCSLGEALATMLPSGKLSKKYAKALETARQKGRNHEEASRVPEAQGGQGAQEARQPEYNDNSHAAGVPTVQGNRLVLNEEQRAAVEAILQPAWRTEAQHKDAQRTDTQRNFYLYGKTGSGKTEVFLQAAEAELAQGRGVIYLVPEIALSQQLQQVVRERFGEQMALVHSGLTPSLRMFEWQRILTGQARFVLGARSAVFAPLENIGLIIIDEEPDGSYKSGASPRYHARQLALYRAEAHKARLVMGSATPSVEAWHFMHTAKAHFLKLELRQRVSPATSSHVRIVKIVAGQGSIGEELKQEIYSTLERRKQVLLFLNRRGFAYFIHCKSCGMPINCPRCSVSLVYHKSEQQLRCHVCSFSYPYILERPQVCAQCGSLDMGYAGIGTEKIEEEVAALFPSARIDRIDSDTVSRPDDLQERLSAFRSGQTDILLGTQMIAKGFNFPQLSLVGVILAESSLLLPDFRSFERTFSLLVQVAGRSGRFEEEGRVVIQSLNPAHHIIRMAQEQDMQGFYERELAQRRELRFPPFRRIVRIVVRGRNLAKVQKFSADINKKIHASLREFLRKKYCEILGPSECSIVVVNKNYRYHILILSEKLSRVQLALAEILRSLKKPANIYVEIDVDPQAML